MKKATTFLSIVLLGASLMSFTGTPECNAQCDDLHLEDISFIEVDEEIDLGFDTAQYLPEGFDAYQGMGPNLEEITFIEPEKQIDLGFDTAQYLPEDFNVYAGMEFDIDQIEYIEEEEEIILDFDVQDYLPADFSALYK